MKKSAFNLVVVCAVGTFHLTAAHAQPPVLSADPTALQSILRWRTAKSANAQRFREKLQNSAAELAAARAVLGDALQTDYLTTTPVPAAENAAPDYRALTKLLIAKPLDEKAEDALGRVASGETLSAEDEKTLRLLLQQRTDVLEIVDRAAAKPRCDFAHDWTQGFALRLPEYGHMRTAARLNWARVHIALREGRTADALRFAQQNYALSDATGGDPLLISYLLSVACETLTLQGFATIVRQRGNDAATLNAVREAIAKHTSPRDARRAQMAEVQIVRQMLGKLQRGTPGEWQQTFADFADDDEAPGAPPAAFTADEQKFLSSVAELAEAEYLRRFAAQMGKTPPAAPVTRQNANPVELFVGAVMIPTNPLERADKRLAARHAVLQAAIAVLLHKNEHGDFPAELKEKHLDPFTQKPLGYRRENGNKGAGFEVYSVGPEGNVNNANPGADEIFFRYP